MFSFAEKVGFFLLILPKKWWTSATQFLARGIPFLFNTWIVRHLTEDDYAVLDYYSSFFMVLVFCPFLIVEMVIDAAFSGVVISR